MQNNLKWLSVVEYFRNKLSNNRILFLQETHSTFNNDENIWNNYFKGPVFYSGNYYEIRYAEVNIHNANTKVEQVQVLSELNKLMKNNFLERNWMILACDFNIFFDNKLETKGS